MTPVTRTTHSTTRPLTDTQGDEHRVYLACFHRIALESLDPRVFSALEAGAALLLRDLQTTKAEP
jgi:hypothetical protein